MAPYDHWEIYLQSPALPLGILEFYAGCVDIETQQYKMAILYHYQDCKSAELLCKFSNCLVNGSTDSCVSATIFVQLREAPTKKNLFWGHFDTEI